MNLSKRNISKYKKSPSGAIVLVILGLFLFSGCYVNYANYGKYQNNREVGRMFESANFLPDYAYYYAHTFSQPEALIGIELKYTLVNNLWTRVNPDQLDRLMDNLWIRSGYSPLIYGSYIVGPEGKIIGIYYSQYSGGAIVMGPDNQVNVNLPNTELRRHRVPSFRFFMEPD